MHRSTLALSLIISCALSTNQASAKMVNASWPIPTDIAREAIHMPTGCVARVIVSDNTLIEASIIDPDCLPTGATNRVVPGRMFDFVFTTK